MTPTDAQDRVLPGLRRFGVFLSVAFAFGGFSFYAAVVVPIGSSVWDATAQGYVTREVTHYLNAANAVALAFLIWEFVAERCARPRWENRLFVSLLGLLAVLLAALLALHPQLAALMHTEQFAVEEPELFYTLHRAYLLVSTLQWLSMLIVIWLTCRVRPTSKQDIEVAAKL